MNIEIKSPEKYITKKGISEIINGIANRIIINAMKEISRVILEENKIPSSISFSMNHSSHPETNLSGLIDKIISRVKELDDIKARIDVHPAHISPELWVSVNNCLDLIERKGHLVEVLRNQLTRLISRAVRDNSHKTPYCSFSIKADLEDLDNVYDFVKKIFHEKEYEVSKVEDDDPSIVVSWRRPKKFQLNSNK